MPDDAPTLDLQRLLDFVNTKELDPPLEQLVDPAALTAWLQAQQLLDSPATATPAQLERATDLREALRGLLLAHHDEGEPPDLGRANELLAATPLRIAFDTDGTPTLRSAEDGVDGALATLVAGIATAVADGTWERAKICPRDTCLWAFYDHSRNRSRRWCSMEVCGNREKSKAFRDRHDA